MLNLAREFIKIFLFLALVALAAGVLMGCGGGETSSGGCSRIVEGGTITESGCNE